MNKPLVSIVTPSLNRAAFIEGTLRSVKNQSYGNIEHIVVDGGSTDGTIDILRRYEKIYNLKWVSEPDGGMYFAINKGFRMATGMIFAYLNSDDIYLPWTLDTIMEDFISSPDIDLVYSDHLDVHPSGAVAYVIQPPFRMNLIQRTGWSLPQPTTFWRREVYEALGGFDERYKICSDADFLLRAAQRFKVRQLREFLAAVMLHGDQLTSTKSNEMMEEIEGQLQRYNKASDTTPVHRFYETKIRAWFWQRVYTAKFLAAYICQKAGASGRLWRNLITHDELAVGSWWKAPLGFLPFSHRSGHKWLIKGKCLPLSRVREENKTPEEVYSR